MSPQLPPRLPMTPAVPLQVKQFSRFWLVSFPICRYEKAYFFEEFYVHRPAFPSHRSHRSKGGGNARRKFWLKPLKETNLGVAQPFFDP